MPPRTRAFGNLQSDKLVFRRQRLTLRPDVINAQVAKNSGDVHNTAAENGACPDTLDTSGLTPML